MQLPQWLARFNRYVTNPVQRLWAGFVPTMGILEHVGRRSGARYRTPWSLSETGAPALAGTPPPLTVFTTDDGIAILLTYGPDRDWLKNISAAGGGRLKRYGRTFTVSNPRVMPKTEAAHHVSAAWRPLFTMLPFESAVLLTRS
ncbi:nitroreductase family deazaflavin-dependent oxidoreductase [Mycobacterium sp. ELW1]|uniref:nitroreductase family deazaflavin-dependent oxidoreductase n=1 Tax=Mycobacterium sp. ELW1 TaxID=1547487 RepID=UPI0011ED08B4|nr:nitroreductase family deazaflavin-dependent oxidoreductase [Mycobacterium sp. ELW1]QEN17001.1 nitroreductase family deazaflavin-dependent oxidoreductase [Mycobacterium sp. ELW1]